jgi:Domain of unknown function (DUF4404)
MTDQTFNELETKIRAAVSEPARQAELLDLLARLKSELAETQRNHLTPLIHPVAELRSSVEGFEQSHPRLVQAVSKVTQTLADLGI